MNKTMFRDFRDKETLNGFMETVRWKLASYYGGPKASGKYFVSNGDGQVDTLYCTGNTHKAKELFDGLMEHEFERAEFSDGRSLTGDDLVQLYCSFNVWYDIYEDWDYDYRYDVLRIMTDEDKPKYFMEPGIIGPVDSEIDTYGTTYFEFDDDCNEILVEEKES